MKQVRILRVIEYTGTPEAVAQAMEQRGVKGTIRPRPNGSLVIREAIIGDTVEFLPEVKIEDTQASS